MCDEGVRLIGMLQYADSLQLRCVIAVIQVYGESVDVPEVLVVKQIRLCLSYEMVAIGYSRCDSAGPVRMPSLEFFCS